MIIELLVNSLDKVEYTNFFWLYRYKERLTIKEERLNLLMHFLQCLLPTQPDNWSTDPRVVKVRITVFVTVDYILFRVDG